MTPAGFTISMSLTVEPTPQGTGARAPIIWERGGDPTPSPRGRAPDSGSGTTGHGGRVPTYTNSWARRAKCSKQETHQVHCPSRKRLPK